VLVRIDTYYAGGASPLHLEAVEPGIASDIENCLIRETGGHSIPKTAEFDLRIIAEKVVRRSLNTVKAKVMKPGTKGFDLVAERLLFSGRLQ
jgi:hypothetical protein